MTTPIDPTPAPAVASPAPQSNPPEQAIAPFLQMLSQSDRFAAERQHLIEQLQSQAKQITEQSQIFKAATEAATSKAAVASKKAEDYAAQVQQLTQAKESVEKMVLDKQQELELITEYYKHAIFAKEQSDQQMAEMREQQELLVSALKAINQVPTEWKAFTDAITLRMDNIETGLVQIRKQTEAVRLPEILFSELSEKLLEQNCFHKDQLKECETRIRKELIKGLGNTVKQLEAFVSIQYFFATGESISDFHGWPISPDIGLFLIEKIIERQYDLIIEFGSGTSTLIFAKALAVNEKGDQQIIKKNLNTLSKKILSIEHDTVYLEKTQQVLLAHNQLDKVYLYHAPLTVSKEGGNEYLYYNCDKVLKQTSELIRGDSSKRILIFVDGPPSSTCENARYLAVPLVFNHFGNHEIDIVLDDSNRSEEKGVIELWRSFWKKHSIHMKEKNIVSEKGIFLASNYI